MTHEESRAKMLKLVADYKTLLLELPPEAVNLELLSAVHRLHSTVERTLLDRLMREKRK